MYFQKNAAGDTVDDKSLRKWYPKASDGYKKDKRFFTVELYVHVLHHSKQHQMEVLLANSQITDLC